MVKYFAYGSNMHKEDLDKWCQSHSCPKINFLSISPAKLSGFQLGFNYLSATRNSGAANLVKNQDGHVYGLLTEIQEADLRILRKKEGYPKSYDEILVEVEKFDGEVVQDVKTYKVVSAREMLSHQPPTQSYLQLLVKSAKEYKFPNEYIIFLESIDTRG